MESVREREREIRDGAESVLNGLERIVRDRCSTWLHSAVD